MRICFLYIPSDMFHQLYVEGMDKDTTMFDIYTVIKKRHDMDTRRYMLMKDLVQEGEVVWKNNTYNDVVDNNVSNNNSNEEDDEVEEGEVVDKDASKNASNEEDDEVEEGEIVDKDASKNASKNAPNKEDDEVEEGEVVDKDDGKNKRAIQHDMSGTTQKRPRL